MSSHGKRLPALLLPDKERWLDEAKATPPEHPISTPLVAGETGRLNGVRIRQTPSLLFVGGGTGRTSVKDRK